MKKLFLTSAGFENPLVKKQFLKLIDKPPSEIKVIFVPTAARTRQELHYVKESKKELLSAGVRDPNIKTLKLNHKILYKEVASFDVIYVCGGNTFYLLDKVKKSGFDRVINRFVEERGLYVGVSAGSTIAGPSVEIAGWGVDKDVNKIGLTDFAGLNLTDVAIFPHYEKNRHKLEVERFRRKVNYTVRALTNNQALLLLNNKTKIIGT